MNRTTHEIEPEEVMAYLDGELEPARAAAVGAHIEQCADCAAVASDLRRVSARMADWQVEPAPPSLDSKVQTAAREHTWAVSPAKPVLGASEERGRLSGMPRLVLAFAGGVTVLVFVFAALMPNLLRSSMPEVAATHPAVPPPTAQAERSSSADKLAGYALPSPAQPLARPIEGRAGGGGGARSGRMRESELPTAGPMIIRTASVMLVAKDFDGARAAVERIVRGHGGHVGQLQTAAPTDAARTLSATLRIPSDRLDAALAELKKLGRVERESQSGVEVTQQYVDLVARLANARHTEQRLVEILRTRTGKVAEVLDVEREIASVREEIERMEAQRKTLANQVEFATLSLELREEFEKKIEVAPPSTGTLLWNAMVEGYNGAVETVLGLALFLLRVGPSLLLWAMLLFFPARFAWRRLRTMTP